MKYADDSGRIKEEIMKSFFRVCFVSKGILNLSSSSSRNYISDYKDF